jgi:hypothetical protein
VAGATTTAGATTVAGATTAATTVAGATTAAGATTVVGASTASGTLAPLTTSPGQSTASDATSVTIVIVLTGALNQAQLDSMLQILAALVNLDVGIFRIRIIFTRSTGLEVILEDSRAGVHANTIVNALAVNPLYLQQRDASLGEGERGIQKQRRMRLFFFGVNVFFFASEIGEHRI